jgi:pimeloyl-ACP methyl ester carboxylesterase
MLNVTYRIVETNGIKMHVAESGKGPLVILCHGFPELWYSWRFQLEAIPAMGFRVVAPDQRGYGKTDNPLAVEEYNIMKLTGDIVGLVHALGEESAIIVGHDWGAPVAWHCALLRPDIFKVLVLMSVPYRTRLWGSTRPTEAMAQMAGERQFYQLYFQEVGKAERELQENVRNTMLKLLYSASGDPPPDKRWRFLFDKSQRFIDTGFLPDTLPSWLTNQDIDYFTREFEKTGFRGGLNWYRNADRNWELTSFLIGAKIEQPTLFIAGELDAVIAMSQRAFDNLEISVPGLKKKVLIPGAGHWVQQERPTEVNRLLMEFLTEVSWKRK